MLYIINAAEAQFRRETESRTRDHALLVSIGDRRAAETALAAATPGDVRGLAPAAPGPIRAAARTTRGIRVRQAVGANCTTTVCAAG